MTENEMRNAWEKRRQWRGARTLRFLPGASREGGFTLIEIIMVMVITGIIGGMVAVFLRAPIQQYTDLKRRADMTDIADTALRRIERDLRLALPNSVRVTKVGSNYYLEFLPTTGGGRYRADVASSGPSAGCGSLAADVLDFTAADTCFEVLGGTMPNVGDQIVVYNLGVNGANAYTGSTAATDNRRVVSAVGAKTVSITSGNPLPFDSPSHRFQVITTPVTYVCAPVAGGGGTLTRWQGYTIQPSQPTAVPAGVTPAVLANYVGSTCTFTYNPNVVSQRFGLVTMNLSITEGNETVTLYSATHVSNVP